MATPRKANPQPGGRPTKYDPKYHPKKVVDLAMTGWSDEKIAKFFEVSEATLNNWKIEHPAFLERLRHGREGVIQGVTKSLYKRANGYKYRETKTEIVPARDIEVEEPDPDDPTKMIKKIVHIPESQELRVETIKQLPPDVGAIKYLLNNRAAEEWRESSHVDMTTKGDKLGDGMDLSKLTDEEVAILAALEAKARRTEI